VQYSGGVGPHPPAKLGVLDQRFAEDGMMALSLPAQPSRHSVWKQRSMTLSVMKTAVDAPGEAPGSAISASCCSLQGD
jgi:hypothetical protein